MPYIVRRVEGVFHEAVNYGCLADILIPDEHYLHLFYALAIRRVTDLFILFAHI